MRPSEPKKVDNIEFDRLTQLRVSVPQKRLPKVPEHSPKPPEPEPKPVQVLAPPAPPPPAVKPTIASPLKDEEEKPWWRRWYVSVAVAAILAVITYFTWFNIYPRYHTRPFVPDEYSDKNVIIVESRMLFGDDKEDFHPLDESLIVRDIVVVKPGNLENFQKVVRKHLARKKLLLEHGKGAVTQLGIFFLPRHRVTMNGSSYKEGTTLYMGPIYEDEPLSFYYFQAPIRDYEYNQNDYGCWFPQPDDHIGEAGYYSKYLDRLMVLMFKQDEGSDFTFFDIVNKLEAS